MYIFRKSTVENVTAMKPFPLQNKNSEIKLKNNFGVFHFRLCVQELMTGSKEELIDRIRTTMVSGFRLILMPPVVESINEHSLHRPEVYATNIDQVWDGFTQWVPNGTTHYTQGYPLYPVGWVPPKPCFPFLWIVYLYLFFIYTGFYNLYYTLQ